MGHGFFCAVYSAHKLVKKSLETDTSLAREGLWDPAFGDDDGETEVNRSSRIISAKCKHSDFDVDKEKYTGARPSGQEMPECGTDYKKDGFDIPFEVFLA